MLSWPWHAGKWDRRCSYGSNSKRAKYVDVLCWYTVHIRPETKTPSYGLYAYSVFRVAVPTAYLQHFLKSIPEYTERSALPQEEVFSFRLLPARNACITVNLSLPWK